MLDGFPHRHKRLASGRIAMATAVEILAGEKIHVHPAPRTKRHPDKLMRGNEDRRQLHRLDRQGIIHEPLAVAGLELKPAHLALQKRHISDRTVVDHLHLAVDRIAEQPGTALGEGVIDIVVDRGNVDARFDQHRNGPVHSGVRNENEKFPVSVIIPTYNTRPYSA